MSLVLLVPGVGLVQDTGSGNVLLTPGGLYQEQAAAAPAAGTMYLGSTEITTLKLGSTNITKAYLGSTQVFGV